MAKHAHEHKVCLSMVIQRNTWIIWVVCYKLTASWALRQKLSFSCQWLEEGCKAEHGVRGEYWLLCGWRTWPPLHFVEYETWPVHPAIRNASSSVYVYAFIFVNHRLHHERQKFCNFIQIISHTLNLFMRCGVTLLFHSAKNHLQETCNINIETDYKT